MNISAPFIRRPVMTTLVMVAILFFGLAAYKFLPVSSLPALEYPTIEVNVSYPGASPQTMAERVASPLEREFLTMQGIKFMTSSSTYESTTLVLQFHLEVNIDVAASEVQEAINKAQAQLPKDLPQLPTYTKTNPSDSPIIYIVVHSSIVPAAELYEWGYTYIGQQIGTVDGVADISTHGYPYAVRVNVDPGALAARSISLQEVSDALNDANPDLPTGKFYGPYYSVTTQTDGQILKAEKYNKVIIKYQDNTPVRIEDIGYAEDSLENDKQTFQWLTKDTKEAVVVLTVNREIGYNTVEICKDIVTMLDDLKQNLPANVDISIPYDSSLWIKESVRDVELTLLVAFFLVILVIFLYLGKFRNTVIPIISLPITIAGTFIVMHIAGFSVDIMSMSAITLSIGFLVDDAIVVLENIVRWVQGGESPFQGAMKGSKQISITVLSISLCLGAVFIPMIFLGGMLGKLLHEFSVVILAAVLISGFVSLTLTPMLCALFVPPYEEENTGKLAKFDHMINAFFLNLYRPGLNWVIKYKGLTLMAGAFCILASFGLFLLLPRSFLPPNDLGVIECFVQTVPGTSPKYMQKYLDQLTEIAINDESVNTVARIDSYPTDNQAIFYLNLIPIDKRPSETVIIPRLKKKFDEVIGAIVTLKRFTLINLQVGGITSGKAAYQYTVQSYNEKELYASTGNLLKKMKDSGLFSEVSSDLELNSPYLDVHIQRDYAHTYSNLTAQDVESALQYAYGETYRSMINTAKDQYYVILQVAPEYYQNPSQIDLVYVGSEDNNMIQLPSVVDTKKVAGTLTVNHIDGLPSVTISFDVANGVPLSKAITAIDAYASETLAPGINGKLAGATEIFEQSFKQMIFLLFIAIIVIYLILGILYENFIHPIAALSAIPVATLGALLTLFIFNISLSLFAFIGIIMLLGIVMKNGILIIDFALEYMEEKKESASKAAYEACVVRFRPILMTTLAAMMGAVPIALGIGGTVAEGRAPLGIVIVGGLIFSQAVTLFITPVVFILMCKLQDFLKRHFKLFQPKIEP